MVEITQRLHINARNLQDIVLAAFAPLDVKAAVTRLLSDPTYDKVDLYRAIINALTDLEPRLRDTPRNISMLAAEISRYEKVDTVNLTDIHQAVLDLARASSGILHLSEDDEVFVIGTLDELRRRISPITGEVPPPRRRGTFRPPAAST